MTALTTLALASSTAQLFFFSPNIEFPAHGPSLTMFEPIHSNIDFNEAIVSWNVDEPSSAAVKVEAQAATGDRPTKWYTLADWAGDAHLHPRMSIDHQKDQDGTVMTDTLHLDAVSRTIRIRVTLEKIGSGATPKLKFITVSLSNTGSANPDAAAPSDAWGKSIDVPERAQGNYPNGGVLCSATSVSMLLWHYSNVLNRPDLNQDVPVVEAGVWDSVYKGAGNWPFNTAYAGSFPGMRAYVARFNDISDLDKWIGAGLPVACSVSFDMLRGKPLSPTESGHLIVLVGFTKDGDPIVNDPAFKGQVRKSYKRSDFEKAWLYSHRTVYLIYPEGADVPPNTDHLWAGK